MNINIKMPAEKTQQRLLRILLCLCVLVLAVKLVQAWVADVCRVPTDSMENAVMAGDRLVVRKTLEFGRSDVIVFNHPNGDNLQLVKRCIGLPGDTVRIVRSVIYINGQTMAAIPTVRKCSWDFPLDFPLRSLGWDINNYGPVVAPAKGLSVPLDSANINLYRNMIRAEGHEVSCTDGVCCIDAKHAKELLSKQMAISCWATTVAIRWTAAIGVLCPEN